MNMLSSDYRLKAREALAGNWVTSVLVALVAAILGGLVAGTGFSLNLDLDESTLRRLPEGLLKFLAVITSAGVVLSVIRFILGGVVKLGHCRYLLKQQDWQKPSFGDMFAEMNRFGDGFVLNLLTGLYISLWSLLFVIPGIVAGYRYAMASFILQENPGMTASEAISASKRMMDGHKWQLFCLDFSFFGWNILCIFTLGIGYLFLNPYMSAAHAAFYRDLSGEHSFHQNPTSHADRTSDTPWDY